MSTTRSPSLASRDGTPELMSPSAKIKALLATVDSSDDENSTTKPTADTMKISLSFERQASSPTQTQAETEDDEEEQVRPRGRLAARMHAAMNKTSEGNADQVLERANANEDDTIMTDGEDEDLPTAPRRLKRGALREATPTDTETSTRSASPGLFVSSPMRPSPTKSAQDTGSEADLPAPKSNRFTALVERKKQERLAREAVEEAKREERRARLEKLSSELAELDAETGNVSDITDDEGGRKLTQDVRPTRKASKRAIEEMNRETQRMARNMQLAHEAKTRKKISKNSLFERFNFRPAGEAVADPKTASSSRPTTPIQSDVDMKDTETPPSSPPSSIKKAQHAKLTINDQPAQVQDISDGEMPTLDEIVASQKATLDKGKGKAVDVDLPDLPVSKLKRHFRIRLPQPSVNLTLVDSDDELQITTTSKDRMKALFDSIPTTKPTEAKSLHALKALAQVRSPGRRARRKGEQTGMSMGALHISLQQKARQQAKLERDRRMESLKAQGVVVQTAEEREKEMQEVEDIVAKAREEAEKIREAEKGEDEKNKDGSEKPSDPLAWDDSDDEEYQASGDEADAEASAVELSGSEDEEDAEQGEESGEDVSSLMFDDAASDAESEAPKDQPSVDKDEDVNMDEEEEYAPAPLTRRARKHVTIVSDDEAEDEAEPVIEATPKSKSLSQATPRAPNPNSTTPGSVLRSAKKSFIPGLPVTGAAGIGLTQMFAGTMDDSQMSPGQAPTQSMMPDFDAFPDSNFSATMDVPPETNFTQGPNTQAETQGIQLNYSQSQLRSMDSLLRDDIPATQYSEMIEPSQDGGFQERTPLRERFMEPPHSTVATVVVDNSQVPESPLVRRGRLRRKMDATSAEDDTPPTASVSRMEASAFSAIKDGAEKAKKKKKSLEEAFDKKRSKAGEMVQEQADESEDEYAGLGGADGEDSDNESVGSIKELIDDVAGNDLDEGKLAAFYADRERANDEKQVEQLFKDITNGALRRKRGADYDLSDSDDGGEARRRMKRRQFAKMQKALFSDERVKKMAENPGNQAFLKTIEDRGSDDEMEFLDIVEEPSQEESQSQEASQQQQQQVEVVPDSQPARMALGTVQENRAPASLRRTKGGRKPANLGEVRETLSSLLDEREPSIIPATAHGSDSEDDDRPTTARSDKENRAPNPRRTGVVVDRVSLKRNSSSNLSAASGRLAFTTHGSVSGSFKVPVLLRRATTNSLLSTGPSTTTSSSTNNKQSTGFGDDAKIKKVASKKSGVNAFARENERRGKMMESDRRRQEKKVRGAEKRAPAVKGLFGKGSFE